MVEVLALEIDLGAAEMRRQPFGEIKRAFAADIILQQAIESGLEGRVLFRRLIGLLKLQDQRHQGFGDITAAIGAEMALGVRAGAKGIGAKRIDQSHACTGCRVAAMNWAIFSGLLMPGALSTPEETSTIM